jgi:hypothetical protein
MLNFESSSFWRPREVRADERRNSRRAARASCRVTRLTTGPGLEDRRLESAGAADGTVGTAMLGGGGAGILAALPMPLGSLTELLRPPALPGPRGMPLTPASCASDGAGARQTANANAKTHDLPDIDHLPAIQRKARFAVPGPDQLWSRGGLLIRIPVVVCPDNKNSGRGP